MKYFQTRVVFARNFIKRSANNIKNGINYIFNHILEAIDKNH